MAAYYQADSLAALSNEDILALLLISASLTIASSTGVGGGSITIPLLILLLHFKGKYAIPLGNIAVLGSSLLSFAFNINKRSLTYPTELLIDWDVISIMEPATMLGTLIGVYLHNFMPERIMIILLEVILIVTASRMLYKGIIGLQSRNKVSYSEYKTLKQSKNYEPIFIDKTTGEDTKAELESIHRGNESPISILHFEIYKHQTPLKSSTQPLYYQALESNEILQPSTLIVSVRQPIPWATIGILVLLFTGTAVVNIIKQFTVAYICINRSCQWPNVICSIINISYIAILGIWLRQRVVTKNINEHISDLQIEGKFVWNIKNSIIYPALCSIAGILAGAFGIGGGIIKTPLMLEMGMNPHAASATSSTMILFTAITASLSFITSGSLVPSYALLMFCIGMLSSLTSQKLLIPFIVKHGHVSITTILVGILIIVSALLLELQ